MLLSKHDVSLCVTTLQWICLVILYFYQSPVLMPHSNQTHGWLLYYYYHCCCCCCSSCLAGRHVWPRLLLPPSHRTLYYLAPLSICSRLERSIFRALLSAVMAAGSLASFNPSLPLVSWLAEGMPLRSKPLKKPWHHWPPPPPPPPHTAIFSSQMFSEECGGYEEPQRSESRCWYSPRVRVLDEGQNTERCCWWWWWCLWWIVILRVRSWFCVH